MIEQGISIDDLAAHIGVNRSTIYRRFKDGSFSVSEADKIAKLLNLDGIEVANIFFARDIA